MRISDVSSSIYKLLYETLEVPFGIRVVENASFIDFAVYDKWIAIDSLTHTTGSIPRALYFFHVANKDTGPNDIRDLNRLTDKVLDIVNQGARFNVYNDLDGTLIGEMEVSETSLSPVIKHPEGGNYRSLTVGLVYAGETPT